MLIFLQMNQVFAMLYLFTGTFSLTALNTINMPLGQIYIFDPDP